jgi:hypothetical protein
MTGNDVPDEVHLALACKYNGKNGSDKEIKYADFEGFIPIS